MAVWIVGAGSQGCVAAAIVRATGRTIAGVLDDNSALHGKSVAAGRVAGGIESVAWRNQDGSVPAFVAIGNNTARRSVADRLRSSGADLINAIHSSATLMEGVVLGTGIMVAAGAVVVSGTRIEDDVVVNTRASIDHDSLIGAGAYLSPGVCTAGCVGIGENSFLGLGALCGPNVKIGANTVVGAGSLVLNDLPDNVIAWGTPATVREKMVGSPDWRRILAR